MNKALEQAAQALFLSSPNPRVGCVIVDASDRIIGQGFTQQAGGPHAEVMACAMRLPKATMCVGPRPM
jgi:diaminohydroxyphosphoribosylaminopyrimidine deaminase/5-amino-6-(5-phosphoribosylamino)uracil reductase